MAFRLFFAAFRQTKYKEKYHATDACKCWFKDCECQVAEYAWMLLVFLKKGYSIGYPFAKILKKDRR